MLRAKLSRRECDDWGCGHYGAPRGGRVHKGVDLNAAPGTEILSPRTGTVTKLGHPYSDDLSFRYVEVTDREGNRHRVFYVLPLVKENESVTVNTRIGLAQSLEERYPGITPHIHYEVINRDGKHVDPEKVK